MISLPRVTACALLALVSSCAPPAFEPAAPDAGEGGAEPIDAGGEQASGDAGDGAQPAADVDAGDESADGGAGDETADGGARLDAGAPPVEADAGALPSAPTGPIDLGCDDYPFSADALLAERVGFGRRATGGDADKVYRVTTLSGGTSDVASNKTVDGRGRDVHIEGTLRLEDTRNVILTDLTLSNDLEGHCTQAGDVLLLRGTGTNDAATFSTRDIWLHHLDLGNGGDGLLDLRGASRVTVSWTHLHTHKKGLLFWTDRNGDETPGMHVTMHHNHFDRISLRGPQLVHGRLHYFNNFQDRWYEYGAGSLGGAQLYSEANVYRARESCSLADYAAGACEDPNPCGDNQPWDGRTSALVTDWAENGPGLSKSVGDLAENGAVIAENQPAQVFDPAAFYAWQAEPATPGLATRVAEGSGPRVDYCAP
jgi:hypothetical protein